MAHLYLNTSELLGQDLAGFHIEEWYRLEYDTDPGKAGCIEHYKSRDLALAMGERAGDDGRDLTPKVVYVLTRDGQNGISVGMGSMILVDPEKALARLRKKYQVSIPPKTAKVLGR